MPNAMYIKWNIENQFKNRKPIIFKDIFRVWIGTVLPKDKFNIKARQRKALGRSCDTKHTNNFSSLKISIKVFYLILHREFWHQQVGYVNYQAVSRPKIFVLYHCFQKTVAFFESNKMRTDKNISLISIIKIAFY